MIVGRSSVNSATSSLIKTSFMSTPSDVLNSALKALATETSLPNGTRRCGNTSADYTRTATKVSKAAARIGGSAWSEIYHPCLRARTRRRQASRATQPTHYPQLRIHLAIKATAASVLAAWPASQPSTQFHRSHYRFRIIT
jgi:hypothetical protein